MLVKAGLLSRKAWLRRLQKYGSVGRWETKHFIGMALCGRVVSVYHNLSNNASLIGKPLKLVRRMKRLHHGTEFFRP